MFKVTIVLEKFWELNRAIICDDLKKSLYMCHTSNKISWRASRKGSRRSQWIPSRMPTVDDKNWWKRTMIFIGDARLFYTENHSPTVLKSDSSIYWKTKNIYLLYPFGQLLRYTRIIVERPFFVRWSKNAIYYLLRSNWWIKQLLYFCIIFF